MSAVPASSDSAAPTREQLLARIAELEAELRRHTASGAPDRATDRLTTVKVPPEFEAPFLSAQALVTRYFADRVEHPDTATISIAGERYVLLRAASLSVEFVELVMKLYQDKGADEARAVANNLLFDLAHAIGRADARAFGEKMSLGDPIANLSAGPIHFAFSGWAFVDILPESKPTPNEDYFLLYDHPFSFESHSWLAKHKRSETPVCIMSAGYSSGWCEQSFGLPLVSVEVECLAAGGRHCRFIMAPPSRIESHLERHARAGGGHVANASGGQGVVPEFFQRKRLEDELRQANEQLEARVHTRARELERATEQLRLLGSAVENATEGFVILEVHEDEDPLRVVFVNHGFSRITGYRSDEVVGRSLAQLRLATGEEATFTALVDSVRRGEPFQAEAIALRPDASVYALELHAMPVPNEAGRAPHWIAILRDVSDRKAHLDALRHQALHDALTGLPNRVLLHDRIEQCITGMRRYGRGFSLLFLDLDGFKEINDTFGHLAGDALLAEVATRLRGRLSETDTIARLGGDEFAVVLEHASDPSTAGRSATMLLAALEEPFEIEGHTLVVGASIGMVRCPEHGTDPTTLMRRADVAMYAAKGSRAGAMVYDPQQDAHSPARIRLVNELRAAIGGEAFELHYQPQIDLRSGKVARAEALLRWNHPERGLLLPDEFLPLVSSSDLIDRIARWVLHAAIRDCSAWIASGVDAGVSVNLAAHTLRDATLPEFIARELDGQGLPASRLTVEITESSLLEQAVLATDIFERLREIGVGLAIDDFGTGYSSLMHLRHLPFTELKIDRSFTAEMLVNERDAAIVRSTIDLGHELGRSVVAEGVESREVMEQLRRYHCDLVQGYHVSPPLAWSLLREWLQDPPVFPAGS
ncbi:EAL domain-containing protein [Dokdonella sp.]|uniref:EAL domain-containing protein n=1 Tax=Dokdonella sp. TaxID=2291710 RepID=UPI002F403027